MAVAQTTVRAKLNAEVKRVLVREGDTVAAGQTIAEFDTAQLRAQFAERTATLEQQRAQLATSERTRNANAQLVKQNFISQNAFDTADGAYQAQLASVAASKAQLEQIEIVLNDAIVRAPISGTVAKRSVQPGEKVAFDAPMLQIVDLSLLEVQVQTPSNCSDCDAPRDAGQGRHRRDHRAAASPAGSTASIRAPRPERE
jgi:RND family efflux transporter MFP subunit